MYRILIVDDELLVRIGLKSLLEETGLPLETEAADDGFTALSKAIAFSPDLIFVDIEMPKLNGFEFINQIKADLPNTRFIILTCYTDAKNVRKATQAGVSDYIVKTELNQDSINRILYKYLDEESLKPLFNGLPESLQNRGPVRLYTISDTQHALEALAHASDDLFPVLILYATCHFGKTVGREKNPSILYDLISDIVLDYGKGHIFIQKDYSVFITLTMKQLRLSREKRDSLNAELISQLVSSLYIYLNERYRVGFCFCNEEDEIEASLLLAMDKLRKDPADSLDPLYPPGSLSDVGNIINHPEYPETEVSMSETDAMIRKTHLYIRNHLNDHISLQTVAEYVNISPNYFSRLFKEYTGKTFIDYCIEERILKAKEYIRNGEKIYIAANKVGYYNYSYFSKLFKSQTNMTPEEYRRQLQAPP